MTEHRHYDSHDNGAEWATPEHIWKPLADTLDGFDLDPASGAEDTPIADERYTVEDNGLEKPWYGDVWLNPPYGRGHNYDWGEKALDEYRFGNVESISALVPASTDTQWFQHNYAEADYLTFIKGRISFNGAGDQSASFANVIATYENRELPTAYYDALDDLGFTTRTI